MTARSRGRGREDHTSARRRAPRASAASRSSRLRGSPLSLVVAAPQGHELLASTIASDSSCAADTVRLLQEARAEAYVRARRNSRCSEQARALERESGAGGSSADPPAEDLDPEPGVRVPVRRVRGPLSLRSPNGGPRARSRATGFKEAYDRAGHAWWRWPDVPARGTYGMDRRERGGSTQQSTARHRRSPALPAARVTEAGGHPLRSRCPSINPTVVDHICASERRTGPPVALSTPESRSRAGWSAG